jgi:hypothetical protein
MSALNIFTESFLPEISLIYSQHNADYFIISSPSVHAAAFYFLEAVALLLLHAIFCVMSEGL